MIIDLITLAGFILAVFISGIAVGKLVEKIERFIKNNDDEDKNSHTKNDRR